MAAPKVMTRDVVYVPNHIEFGKFMRSAPVRAEVEMLGAAVTRLAMQNSPASVTGEYRSSFHVEASLIDFAGRGFSPASGRRWMVKVVNDAPYAAQVEWGVNFGYKGSRRQGGSHGRATMPLTKALIAMGGDLNRIKGATAVRS